MGATSWYYFTPYQADPGRALQRLRAEVFAQGRYVDVTRSPEEGIRGLYDQSGLGADSSECRQALDQVMKEQRFLETGSEQDLQAVSRGKRASLRRARDMMKFLGPSTTRRRQSPRTIDELLEQAAESGTHSVLDITHIAARRADGAAAPLSPRELQKIFGTAKPTRAQAEELWADIVERLNRWQAYYFIVHKDDQPHEFAFVGCSGD